MRAACYFGSRNLYDDMIPAAKSLIKNSNVQKVWLLIEDDTFPHELPSNGIIETLNVKPLAGNLFDPTGPNIRTEWTYMGLIRGALTKVFPKLDKILSIDCDAIVDKDISDSWDIDLTNYYVAGVNEPTLTGMTHCLYINAGVTMFNLAKLREDGKDDEMIRLINTKRMYFISQDAMVSCLQGGILELPNEYNACDYTGLAPARKRVIHYAGKRDWRDLEIVKKYRNMPWESLRPHG